MESAKRFLSRFPFRRRYLALLLSNRLVFAGVALLILFAGVAILAPLLTSFGPYEIAAAERLEPPTAEHLMGTDNLGRDIYSRVLYGARISLTVATLTTLISAAVGAPLGLIAGYYRERLYDTLIMRVVDMLFAIPTIVLAITVIAALGRETELTGFFQAGFISKIVLVLGVTFAPRYSRLVRSQVVSLMEEDWIKALRIMGASDRRIMMDLLRSCQSVILIQASLVFGIAIIVESTLSFLGLGIPPPEPSWGTMLSLARDYIFSGEWWLALFPGTAIFLSVMGANMVGDGLRDFMDPHVREIMEFGQ